MDLSIKPSTMFENASEVIESLNLLFFFMMLHTRDVDALYSTIETKLGYKWDGDGWLNLNCLEK